MEFKTEIKCEPETEISLPDQLQLQLRPLAFDDKWLQDDIQNKIKNSFLYKSDNCDDYSLSNIYLIQNNSELYEKRLEQSLASNKKRKKSEIEKSLFYFCDSDSEIRHICTEGFTLDQQEESESKYKKVPWLGSFSSGIYLTKHFDIGLKHYQEYIYKQERSKFYCVMAKASIQSFGLVRPRSTPKTLDNNNNNELGHSKTNDCIYSTFIPTLDQSIHQQYVNSLCYIFDYDSATNKMKQKPDNLLPYALLEFEKKPNLKLETFVTFPKKVTSYSSYLNTFDNFELDAENDMNISKTRLIYERTGSLDFRLKGLQLLSITIDGTWINRLKYLNEAKTRCNVNDSTNRLILSYNAKKSSTTTPTVKPSTSGQKRLKIMMGDECLLDRKDDIILSSSKKTSQICPVKPSVNKIETKTKSEFIEPLLNKITEKIETKTKLESIKKLSPNSNKLKKPLIPSPSHSKKSEQSQQTSVKKPGSTKESIDQPQSKNPLKKSFSAATLIKEPDTLKISNNPKVEVLDDDSDVGGGFSSEMTALEKRLLQMDKNKSMEKIKSTTSLSLITKSGSTSSLATAINSVNKIKLIETTKSSSKLIDTTKSSSKLIETIKSSGKLIETKTVPVVVAPGSPKRSFWEPDPSSIYAKIFKNSVELVPGMEEPDEDLVIVSKLNLEKPQTVQYSKAYYDLNMNGLDAELRRFQSSPLHQQDQTLITSPANTITTVKVTPILKTATSAPVVEQNKRLRPKQHFIHHIVTKISSPGVNNVEIKPCDVESLKRAFSNEIKEQFRFRMHLNVNSESKIEQLRYEQKHQQVQEINAGGFTFIRQHNYQTTSANYQRRMQQQGIISEPEKKIIQSKISLTDYVAQRNKTTLVNECQSNVVVNENQSNVVVNESQSKVEKVEFPPPLPPPLPPQPPPLPSLSLMDELKRNIENNSTSEEEKRRKRETVSHLFDEKEETTIEMNSESDESGSEDSVNEEEEDSDDEIRKRKRKKEKKKKKRKKHHRHKKRKKRLLKKEEEIEEGEEVESEDNSEEKEEGEEDEVEMEMEEPEEPQLINSIETNENQNNYDNFYSDFDLIDDKKIYTEVIDSLKQQNSSTSVSSTSSGSSIEKNNRQQTFIGRTLKSPLLPTPSIPPLQTPIMGQKKDISNNKRYQSRNPNPSPGGFNNNSVQRYHSIMKLGNQNNFQTQSNSEFWNSNLNQPQSIGQHPDIGHSEFHNYNQQQFYFNNNNNNNMQFNNAATGPGSFNNFNRNYQQFQYRGGDQYQGQGQQMMQQQHHRIPPQRINPNKRRNNQMQTSQQTFD